MFAVDVSADGVVYVSAAVGARVAAVGGGAAVTVNGGADVDVAVSAAVVYVAVVVVGDGDEMLVGEAVGGNSVLCLCLYASPT